LLATATFHLSMVVICALKVPKHMFRYENHHIDARRKKR